MFTVSLEIIGINELARMDLVSAHMSLETALNQLESMCADAVFQPEAELTRVHLLGPLEASGLEFDAIRLTGMTAANWPPAGNPSALVSRRLQEEHGMPDAVPAETLTYAQDLVNKLCSSAPDVVCSYPLTEDEAEQTPSEVLKSLLPEPQGGEADPGWFAAQLVLPRGRTSDNRHALCRHLLGTRPLREHLPQRQPVRWW